MKILLTGFKPYDKFKVNITEKIVRRVNKKRNLKKIIFPVVFKGELIIDKIKKLKPDIVLSLGQHPRARLLNIERKAKNERKGRKGRIRKINQKGSKKYFVNLKLKKIKGARLSYDAGSYVCNFLMYVVMEYIRKKNLPTKFAFIHVPQDYSLEGGVKIIEKILKQLTIR